jgi:hypothetical protein
MNMTHLSGAEQHLRLLLLADPRLAADCNHIDDCAALASEIGAADAARALRDLASIRRGYAPEGSRTALSATPLDRVVADVAALMRMHDPAALQVDLVHGEQHGRLPEDLPAFVGATCAALHGALAQDHLHDDLAVLLTRLERAVLAPPPVDLADHADAPIETLTAAFAFRGLQDFLLVNYDLAFAPLGSAALFHASARRDPCGLGAYLGNLRHCVRGGADVAGLIEIAAAGEARWRSAEQRERWSALLSTGLSEWQRSDLVDVLADDGMTLALRSMLRAAERRLACGHRELHLLWRLRDAAADNGDLHLAIHVQWRVAETRVSNAWEWALLGDMRATIGDVAAADVDYRFAQGFARDDPGILARRDAVARGSKVGLEAIGGWGTPRGRQRRRLARAGILPSDPIPLADQRTG